MQIKYLIEKIRSISGYQEKTSSRVNANKLLINDNMIFQAINEAQKFIETSVMPNAFNVPLNIDLETDVLGSDLIRAKLSSFNEGAKVDYNNSTILGSEKLPIPNHQKQCSILGLNIENDNNNLFLRNGSFCNVVYNQSFYLAGSYMGKLGQVSVNKYLSSTFESKDISTFKTTFIAKDKNDRVVGTYSVTTDTNVYSFYIQNIRVSINYEDGIITFDYTGQDANNYTVDIHTLYQADNVLYFNKGALRASNRFVVNNMKDISIRISPYSVHDPTQKICSIYDEDLIDLLAYRSAVEVQRFNRSVDQNLIDIVYNKQKEYQNRERFKTMEKSNDLIYPSSYFGYSYF